MRIFYRILLNVYYYKHQSGRMWIDHLHNVRGFTDITAAVKLLNLILSKKYYKHMSNADKTTIAKIIHFKNKEKHIPDSYCVNDIYKTVPNIFKIFSRYGMARKITREQQKLAGDCQDFKEVYNLINYSDYEVTQILRLLKKIMRNCIKDITYFS